MSSVTAVPLRPIAKGALAKLWFGIILLVAIAGLLAWQGTRAHAPDKDGTAAQFLAWNAKQEGVVTTDSGLQYKVIKAGSGAAPTDDDVATISYKGELRDGTVFDQAPSVQFPVGQMVPGFSEALKLMPRGSRYKIWIPPALGYGDQSPSPMIPANSVLVFEVEMFQFASIAELQRQMMLGGGAGGAGAADGQDPHGGH